MSSGWRVVHEGRLADAMRRRGVRDRLDLAQRLAGPYEAAMRRPIVPATIVNSVRRLTSVPFAVDEDERPVLATARVLVDVLRATLDTDDLLAPPTPVRGFSTLVDDSFHARLDDAGRAVLDSLDTLPFDVLAASGGHETASVGHGGWIGLTLALMTYAAVQAPVAVVDPGDLLARLGRHPGLPRVAEALEPWIGVPLRVRERRVTAADAAWIHLAGGIVMAPSWWEPGYPFVSDGRSWLIAPPLKPEAPRAGRLDPITPILRAALKIPTVYTTVRTIDPQH